MKINSPQPLALDFQGRNVRTVHIHGLPWFVVKDACEIIGIRHVGSAMRNLREVEKGVLSMHTPGGNQEMAIVSESGLYALIFQSRKPAAQDFRFWVTNEVLPALRKTGFYSLGRERMEDKANWEFSRCRGRLALLKELTDLEREPKVDLEYLTVADFLERQGIKLETRTEAMSFARQVQLACRQMEEYPVKQYRRRNRIPATLWPEPVLRQCMSLLPPPMQPTLPLS